jgi:hypothetical protein
LLNPWTGLRSAAIAIATTLLLAGCGGGGDGGAATSVSATTPAITSQPQAQNVTTGSTATFSVTASGSAPLSYQWNRNGTAIAGATGATYTTGATALTDSGATFSVVVSNSMGQVTSSTATLTALDAAAITSQPQSQTVTTGDTATFSVAATGSSLSYQWSKNGTAISGATAASYSTPAVTLGDSGATFTVAVSNAASKATSTSATLSANADPEGLYLGTLHYAIAGTTLPMFAIVLKDGTAAAFVTDHVLAVNAPVGYSLHGISVKPTGASFSSSYTALLQSGYLFANNQPTATGTMTGTIVPGSSISGTFVSDSDNGTFQLAAMVSDYNRAATFATTAGTYAYDSPYRATTTSPESVFHTVTTGSGDGSGSSTTNIGCTSTGVTNTIPNPAHNAYLVTADFACAVPPNLYPTLAFTALSAFFPAGTGAGIVGTSAFSVDTTVIITDDPVESVAYMIISAKQ